MKFALTDCSVLSSTLRGAGMKLVDIGGRGPAFAPFGLLAPVADYYVSEPDPAEAERLRSELPQEAPWRTVTVLSEAIASRRGEAPLYVTRNPGMSSLLEPDPAVTRRFYVDANFQVESVASVVTMPLDDAASVYGFEDACFLKLDTQGTELDILRSGQRLLRDSLVGVHTESLFQPFYKGQSLFADVDDHLRRNGFSLFSLSRTMTRRSGYRESVFSRRAITWAHCLYFREPETLLHGTRDTLHRNLVRLLALALAFQHHDLAFELVALARRTAILAPHHIDQLVDDVERVVAFGTSRMARKAEKSGSTDDLLAPNFRDKKHIE